MIAPLFAAACLTACASLSDRAAESLAAPGLEGARWGLVVMTLDGRELASINADERFLPASNTKLFTAAAAFHRLGDLTQPDPRMGTSVRLVPHPDGPPDLVLVGAGDPTLTDATDCLQNCLSHLADAVAAQGITEIGAIIADESLFPAEPWPPGWNQDDLATLSGAPVSALTVNSNVYSFMVGPAARLGDPAQISPDAGGPPQLAAFEVVTVDGVTSPDDIVIENGQAGVRLHGRVGGGNAPFTVRVATRDPAREHAFRMVRLLQDRIAFEEPWRYWIATRTRPLALPGEASPPLEPLGGVELARLVPPPLIENVTFLVKQSQNLHAELLLRRIGLADGDGSREAGLKVVEAMLGEIGVPRWSWDFSDGSGMSAYNRVTPRAVATLLKWTTQQPWGDAFRQTLPIGGVDGTIARRFRGTLLEGRIFAKTGTLMGTNALSGFMTTKSGQTLIFSAIANERPSTAGSAIAALDATLVTIAETH